jgi:hypothetical protein
VSSAAADLGGHVFIDDRVVETAVTRRPVRQDTGFCQQGEKRSRDVINASDLAGSMWKTSGIAVQLNAKCFGLWPILLYWQMQDSFKARVDSFFTEILFQLLFFVDSRERWPGKIGRLERKLTKISLLNYYRIALDKKKPQERPYKC